MNYLLDTQAFLWALSDPEKLSAEATRIIRNPDRAVFVSAVTAVEIAVKTALGKLQAPANLFYQLAERGFRELPLRYLHGQTLQTMEGHHADPFDRMLIAQAIEEKLSIITHDRKFQNYPVKIVWT